MTAIAMRTVFRLAAPAIGAFVGACALTSAAYAGYAAGGWVYLGPYGGHDYMAQAIVRTNIQSYANGGVWAQTGGSQTPTGYLGVQGSLWRSTGVMCADTWWDYNDSPLVGMQITTQDPDCGPGNYWGDGQMAAYRPGNGTYAYAYPPASPIQYQNN